VLSAAAAAAAAAAACCHWQVIVLLNTCGGYFSKGAAKRRLDRFLTFLQAYVLAKHTLPLDVDADLQVGGGGLRYHLAGEGCSGVQVGANVCLLSINSGPKPAGVGGVD
jgi:hypothetical protein